MRNSSSKLIILHFPPISHNFFSFSGQHHEIKLRVFNSNYPNVNQLQFSRECSQCCCIFPEKKAIRRKVYTLHPLCPVWQHENWYLLLSWLYTTSSDFFFRETASNIRVIYIHESKRKKSTEKDFGRIDYRRRCIAKSYTIWYGHSLSNKQA